MKYNAILLVHFLLLLLLLLSRFSRVRLCAQKQKVKKTGDEEEIGECRAALHDSAVSGLRERGGLWQKGQQVKRESCAVRSRLMFPGPGAGARLLESCKEHDWRKTFGREGGRGSLLAGVGTEGGKAIGWADSLKERGFHGEKTKKLFDFELAKEERLSFPACP